MGNAPSVSIFTEVLSPLTEVPYLNHGLITFRPSTTNFNNAFIASNQTWMFRDPNTLQGLVAELTPNNWRSRLQSLGATPQEPIWIALQGLFSPQSVADATGARERIPLPDKIYIGRRTSAVVSQITVTFANNTAGRVRFRVNPSKFNFPTTGSLADVTVIADGVLTANDLAEDLRDQLNAIPEFSPLYLAAAPGAGVVTITSLVAGFPTILDIQGTTPGPTVTQAVTTANVANAYRDDLVEMQRAAETDPSLDPPSRKWYWITDLQGDDTVNAEGLAWVEAQFQLEIRKDYIFQAWSTTGNNSILLGGDLAGNFDPAAVASASQVAKAANGGLGWSRGSIIDHDRWEFVVPAMFGRCIGWLPGQVSFTSKVLFGATNASRMTGRDYGDDEVLSKDRTFNWYSAEGPRGSLKWGYTADGSFVDRVWLADYTTYIATVQLIQWMQLNQIIQFADDDIISGAGVIANAMARIPAITPETIVVTFLPRAAVSSNDIANRVYRFYASFADSFGIINEIGTPDDPITISLVDG